MIRPRRYGTALTKRGLELKDVAISESTVEIASLIEESSVRSESR